MGTKIILYWLSLCGGDDLEAMDVAAAAGSWDGMRRGYDA